MPEEPKFNEEQFLEDWDTENPEIIVAEETEDHIDNDWILTEEEQDELIRKYLNPEGDS